jgi:putative transposase
MELLRQSLSTACTKFDTKLEAWVVLPDHLHLIAGVDEEKLPLFMRGFKRGFGLLYRKKLGLTSGRVWQLRYWDHAIRNQADLNRHLDYVHYNPVRHGLTDAAANYPHSSFRKFVEAGQYDPSWGNIGSQELTGDFGE